MNESLSAKVKAAVYVVFTGIASFISFVATLPPDTQTGVFRDLESIFPVEWRAQIGTSFKLLSMYLLYKAIHNASKSGPVAPSEPKSAVPTPPMPESVRNSLQCAPIAILIMLGVTGCAGTGPNGAWTAGDSAAAVSALNSGISAVDRGIGAYNHYRYPNYPVCSPAVIIP